MDALTVRYGVIVDRLRLPRLMQDGLDLVSEGNHRLTIERVEDLPEVRAWVLDQIHSLLARSS
jgi:hypothetical protein